MKFQMLPRDIYNRILTFRCNVENVTTGDGTPLDERLRRIEHGQNLVSDLGTDLVPGVSMMEVNSGTYQNWSCICRGADKFVAITNNVDGTGCKCAISADGLDWTETGLYYARRNWSSICYGNGKYVVVGKDTLSTMKSENGISWSEGAPLPRADAWNKVKYLNNRYFALLEAGNILSTSPDANVWSAVTLPMSNTWTGMTYGNEKYVISTKTNQYVYSATGLEWNTSEIPYTSCNGIAFVKKLISNNGTPVRDNVFVTLKYEEIDGVKYIDVVYSADMIDWSMERYPVAENPGEFIDIIETPFGFYAIYTNGVVSYASDTYEIGLNLTQFEGLTNTDGVKEQIDLTAVSPVVAYGDHKIVILAKNNHLVSYFMDDVSLRSMYELVSTNLKELRILLDKYREISLI